MLQKQNDWWRKNMVSVYGILQIKKKSQKPMTSIGRPFCFGQKNFPHLFCVSCDDKSTGEIRFIILPLVLEKKLTQNSVNFDWLPKIFHKDFGVRKLIGVSRHLNEYISEESVW